MPKHVGFGTSHGVCSMICVLLHFISCILLDANPFSGIRVPCGRTDMTKPTVAVCSFASALENDGSSIHQLPNVCTSLKLDYFQSWVERSYARAHTTNKVSEEESIFTQKRTVCFTLLLGSCLVM